MGRARTPQAASHTACRLHACPEFPRSSNRQMSLTTRSVEGCGGGSRRVRSGGALAGSPPMVALGAAQRGDADLVLSNGKFVDGRGQVATTLTIRNGRIASVGKTGPVAPDARRSTLVDAPSSQASSTRTSTTRAPASTPATRRAASSERFRSRSCRKRSQNARSRCRPASSSRASAVGTTRSSLKRAARRKRSWMPPRRSTPSTFPAPAVEPARSRTVSAARSWSRRA